MTWPAFWVEQGPEVEIGLRRYSVTPCEARPYHNALVPLGRASASRALQAIPADDYAHDARWPTHCLCGYEFLTSDNWQVWTERVYRRPDTGEEWAERSLPPGTMLDADWYPQKGPDGICLVVVLPPASEDTRGQWWAVDMPSRTNGVDGPGWARNGDPKAVPPTVAASPSIRTPSYHGWLRLNWQGASELSDDVG